MPFSKPSRAAQAVAVLALGALGAIACSADPDQELRDRLATIEDRVIEQRGIDPGDPVTYRFVNEQELSDYLAASLDEDESVEEILHAETVYRLLGLIDQSASLRDLYGDLLDQQVLGAYDSETNEFVVLQTGEDFGALEETTYAHEYVHYLQDTRFDLEALREMTEGNDDFSLALTALIEGDATTTQTQYMFNHISQAGLNEILQGAGPSLDAAQRAPQFVGRLMAQGGREGVDEAFANLPKSTEQIIRFSKYQEGEEPLEVRLPEGLFGEGWTETRSNVLGQFFLQVWLEAMGAVGQNADAASWGWGGDRYAVYKDGSGNSALAAVIAWDEPERDSTEFAQVLSYSFDQQDEAFTKLEGGSPGALQMWDGPGGVVGMVRMRDAEHGAAIGIIVAPTREDVVPALAQMAGF